MELARPLKNIYPKLEQLMISNKDTVDDLCKLIGVNDDTFRYSLRGLRSFRLKEVTILADRYDISIEELFNK